MSKLLDDLTKRAEAAIDKKAPFGEDIDLTKYINPSERYEYVENLETLSAEEKERLMAVGIDTKAEQRSGSFIQHDTTVRHRDSTQEGVEVMGTAEALAKYDWMEEYWWKAVAVDQDKYTAHVQLHQNDGYFIRTLPGVKTTFPLQACLYLKEEQITQNVHNIIIAEEGSELHIITGCTTGPHVKEGIHLGVSEFFIKKGAKVSFTMIHGWNENVAVRPRTGIIIEEDGVFLSNYILLRRAHSLQMYPNAYLNGKNSTARFNSIIAVPEGSHVDGGARTYLRAPGAKAEIISRTISTGGTVISRGHMIGEVPGVKAHMECNGLILSEHGIVAAVPELEGRVADVEMSHEAAVGKIAKEEIEYLMARGLSEDEAKSTIIRGFLDVKIMGLPPHLENAIKKAVETGQQGFM
ncbi:MAG: SufD family Fe-S cluster assembly protein [Candidatus Aquicultor sp.]|nr:SufD family Fe-S cluster assembly protein [Candidatus Aquicultor sp.]